MNIKLLRNAILFTLIFLASNVLRSQNSSKIGFGITTDDSERILLNYSRFISNSKNLNLRLSNGDKSSSNQSNRTILAPESSGDNPR